MKRTVLLFLLIAAAFDFLFWNQTPGLNVFLFSILVVTALYFRFRESSKRIPVAVLAAGALLSGFMVFVHGAGWALAANIISLLLFAAAISSTQLHSVYTFIPQSLLNLVILPVTFGSRLTRVSKTESSDRRFLFYAAVVIVPMLIGSVFYAMYLWGSPHFREANSGLMSAIEEYFGEYPVVHVFFLLWAMFMSAFFLFKGYVSLPEESRIKHILRKKKVSKRFSNMRLKRELIAGTVLLFFLNSLLAVVNYIDIKTVWFDFVVPEHFSLKQFVHNGTWILTICVFMSVGIVLWLFRGNQNYFWKSWGLKLLAYAWIGQNMILTFSVFMRNDHYIGWHGLAYGRIFVNVLMIATFIALALLMVKVSKKYNGHYFFRINSWLAYALIIVCSFVNWDRVIFNYNIAHWNVSQIDYAMYAKLGPEIYPDMYAHHNEVDKQITAHAHNPERWVYWESTKAYWDNVRYYKATSFREIVFQDWQSYTIEGRNSIQKFRALGTR